jgi:hypothetical protein
VIGEVRPSNEGITMVTNGTVESLTPAIRDEIARAFEAGLAEAFLLSPSEPHRCRA